ncbi:hypothetical protein ACFLR1_04775 [Bacteroidota bacterium]
MSTEKKCPHCGTWTTWNKQPTDKCGACQKVLDQVWLTEKIESERKEKEFFETDFLRIRESDGFLKRMLRRTAWVLHAVFAAITWFFLWMVTTFSG